MRKAIASILLVLIVVSTASAGNLEILPPSGNWNKVQSLPAKADITVELRHGGEVTGEFVRLTEDSVLLKEAGIEQNYRKEMVAKVLWLHPGSRAKRAGIVGGIFFGIGFGLGYASAATIADQNSMPAGERAAAGAAIGATIGGIAAAISLAHRPGPKSELVYRAR
jgi:hypothetical protein